jgi:hypothetical protein
LIAHTLGRYVFYCLSSIVVLGVFAGLPIYNSP